MATVDEVEALGGGEGPPVVAFVHGTHTHHHRQANPVDNAKPAAATPSDSMSWQKQLCVFLLALALLALFAGPPSSKVRAPLCAARTL